MVVVRFVLLVSIAASLAAAGTTVAGASPAVSAIDRLVRDGHVPGAAIAVVRDGRLVDERLIGYSDVRNRTTVTRRVRFQLASITKVFTTLALMRLDQQDRLRIEDPVGKYLPRLPPAWREVRIRELAQHISGLPDVIADPNKPLSQTELLQTEDEALSKAIGRSVASFPGETFRYDQTNYVLLKRVIERVTGRSFIDAVHSLLGSRGSGLVWGDGRTRLPSRTRMYEWRGGALLGASGVFAYPAYLDAAAGANASLATMERLAAALTGGRMLNEAHLARLWKPAHRRDGSVIDVGKDFGVAASLSPAMGWFVADNSDGRYPRVFMTGGSATAIMVFPKQRLAVVVLTDLHADDDPLPIAEAAAAPYLPGMRPIF